MTYPFDKSGIAGAAETDILREDNRATQTKKLDSPIDTWPPFLDGSYVWSPEVDTPPLDLFSHEPEISRPNIFSHGQIATAQLTAHQGKTMMVKTIKEDYHSYSLTFISEPNRFALNSLASNVWLFNSLNSR